MLRRVAKSLRILLLAIGLLLLLTIPTSLVTGVRAVTPVPGGNVSLYLFNGNAIVRCVQERGYNQQISARVGFYGFDTHDGPTPRRVLGDI